MRSPLSVKELLTEVGTLVGMYGGEFLIDDTAPGAESIYCEDLGDNGHSQDSLFERWVVLKDSDGVWRQRVISDYSGRVLTFKTASSGSRQVFAHGGGERLYLFDRAAPMLVLRAIVPAVAANPHLAILSGFKTLDLKALHTEYLENQEAAIPTYSEPGVRLIKKDVTNSIFGISDIHQILEIRADGDVVPVDDWEWRFYGNGELDLNGMLIIDNRWLFGKIDIINTINQEVALYHISDWERNIVQVLPRAKECLKYYCAARWMSTNLPSRDEEGWNYAKKTETHFRNRARELEIVLPSVTK